MGSIAPGNRRISDSRALAINVGSLDLLGRGDAQILGDVALVDLGGVGGVSLSNNEGALVANVVGPLGGGTAERISVSLADDA